MVLWSNKEEEEEEEEEKDDNDDDHKKKKVTHTTHTHRFFNPRRNFDTLERVFLTTLRLRPKKKKTTKKNVVVGGGGGGAKDAPLFPGKGGGVLRQRKEVVFEEKSQRERINPRKRVL